MRFDDTPIGRTKSATFDDLTFDCYNDANSLEGVLSGSMEREKLQFGPKNYISTIITVMLKYVNNFEEVMNEPKYFLECQNALH